MYSRMQIDTVNIPRLRPGFIDYEHQYESGPKIICLSQSDLNLRSNKKTTHIWFL